MILFALAINLLPGSVWLFIQLSDLLDLQQVIFLVKAPLVVGRSLMSRAIGELNQLILWSRLIWSCTYIMALSEVCWTKLVEIGLVALLQKLLL